MRFLPALLLLAACSASQQPARSETSDRSGTLPTPTPIPAPASTARADPDPRSLAAARAVVERYYALLAERDYPAAFALWGESGPPNQTRAQFADGFRRTASTSVAAGEAVSGDAGMGQSYATVPVTVDARLADGTHQRFRGTYLLSRVNDVDGSTPAQRRWHLRQADLKAVPAG